MEDQKPFDVRAKLAQELGRVPPETKSSPEDWAPKPKPTPDPAPPLTISEPAIAQTIKRTMHEATGWQMLTPGEQEALDLIATEISRVLVGRNYWSAMIDWVTMGAMAERGEDSE